MQKTRLHRTVLAFGFTAVLLAGVSPAVADENIPPPVAKLSRGIVNVAVGLPGEIICRVVSTAYSEDSIESPASYVGGVLSGLVMGVGWGVVRVGSGLVDVLTFPVPFDDNRPLLEPDYLL